MKQFILDQHKLNSAIGTIYRRFIKNDNSFEVFNEMNTLLIDITNSEYGFIGEVLNDGQQNYLKTHAITNIAWNKETKDFFDENAPKGLEFKNLKTLLDMLLNIKKLLLVMHHILILEEVVYQKDILL